MKKMTVALLMTLALSGCDQPKIDGSSDESLRQSIKQVRASLPADQRAAYDEAIVTLVFTPQRYSELQRAGIDGRSVGIGTEVKGELSGKTGEELISYAEGVRKARAERERDQALQEIAELVQKQQAAAASLQQLTAFQVSRSRFYFEKEEYGRDRPIIALSVANNTDKAVSRAYFRGVLASPGREVPWFSDTFNYQIAGGLEPGEKADWQLAPNPFSDWGKINAPADAVFTVTVTRIDDAQGNPVFGDTLFNERDAERLAELKARYPQAK